MALTFRLEGNIIDCGIVSHDFQPNAKKNPQEVRRIEEEHQKKQVKTIVLSRYSSNDNLILCKNSILERLIFVSYLILLGR